MHVSESSIDTYQSTAPWSGFGSIVALVDKCATPVITFANGEFAFDSETEEGQYIWIINALKTRGGMTLVFREQLW